MATIESSIKLRDGATSTLQSITNSLNTLVNSFEDFRKISGQGFNNIVSSVNNLNSSLNRTESEINQNTTAQNQFNKSLNRASSSANLLWSKLKSIFSMYMLYRGVKATIGIADELTMTTARLNLMNDGLETTSELSDKIYQSAMRSRAGYLATADAVAKLRLRAGDIFTTNDEAIAFSETLNKMFAIAGASQSEMYSATLQLTQALGSGVLRGEEFRAVFEAAPNVIQAVADYLNAPIGKIRDLSNEGQISAQIVKDAMMAAAEKVDEQFKTIPKTWGQVWTIVKNHTIKATEPILERIRNITKSERFIKFADMVGVAIQKTAYFLTVAFDTVQSVIAVCFDFIVEHGNIIKTVFDGVGKTLSTVWNWIVDITNAFALCWDVIEPMLIGLAVAYLPKIIGLLWVKVTALWASFKALMANVGGWLLLNWPILLVAAAIAIVIMICRDMGVTFSEVCGRICGSVMWVGALIANIFIGIYNIGSGVVQAIVNAWLWCCDNISTVFHNIGVWWDNLWVNAEIGFYKFINSVLSKLSSLAQKIKPLTDMLGVDLSGMINNASAGVSSKISSLNSSKRQYKDYTDYQSIDWKTQDYFSLSGAYDKGFNWGSSKASGFSKLSDYLDVSKALQNLNLENVKNSLSGTGDPSGLSDIGKALTGGFDDINDALGKTNETLDSINGNTQISDEDLSYMRDLAEREAINRYTLTDLKVEQNNNNNFANGVDSNAMLELLKKILAEGVRSTANGVHY